MLLDAAGRGVYVGQTMTVEPLRAEIKRWWEGDLRLYLDGKQAAQKRVVGRLSEGLGPLLMGNDANNRRVDGVLDTVVFATTPATPEQITQLNCIPQPSTMTVTPTDGPSVAAGTPVSYDVAITNNSCEEASFNANAFSMNPEIFTKSIKEITIAARRPSRPAQPECAPSSAEMRNVAFVPSCHAKRPRLFEMASASISP